MLVLSMIIITVLILKGVILTMVKSVDGYHDNYEEIGIDENNEGREEELCSMLKLIIP